MDTVAGRWYDGVMNTVVDTIKETMSALDITDAECRLLPESEGKDAIDAVMGKFVVDGYRHRWWADFSDEAFSAQMEPMLGHEHLIYIVPNPSEKVWWFVARLVTCRF